MRLTRLFIGLSILRHELADNRILFSVDLGFEICLLFFIKTVHYCHVVEHEFHSKTQIRGGWGCRWLIPLDWAHILLIRLIGDKWFISVIVKYCLLVFLGVDIGVDSCVFFLAKVEVLFGVD